MQYNKLTPVMYTNTEPDETIKAIFSGTLETTGEHNWRIVVLRKTDMEYVGSCNVDPDKSFIVYMEPDAHEDESLVVMCFDNNGMYNADIIDNVSLCSITFSADISQWMPKLESSIIKTTLNEYRLSKKDHGLRTKPNLPWLYEEKQESNDYTSSDSYFVFVFDEVTKGHFELNNIPTAPPEVGSLLNLPDKKEAIKIIAITATDGSNSSVEVLTDLPHVGMTHDLFSDDTCVASGTLKNTLSIQGGYNIELYRNGVLPYPKDIDKTSDLQITGSEYFDYCGNDGVNLQGYDGRLTCTFPWTMNEGTFTISWTMTWKDTASDYVDLLTIENALRVRMYYDDMQIYVYNYGSISGVDVAYTLQMEEGAHYTLTFDDVALRVRVYENGIKKLDASTSAMRLTYAGLYAKQYLVFGSQVYDDGYRSTTISDFRIFHGRAVSDTEAVTIYNDTINLPAKAVYQVKQVVGVTKDINQIYTPQIIGQNSTISLSNHRTNEFAPLKGLTEPPALILENETFPVDEKYSSYIINASDVTEDQTNFPLPLVINNEEAPHLFEKGRDSWKYWEITQNSTALQAEVVDIESFAIDFESDSHEVISVRFRFQDTYYTGTSTQHVGVRHISFFDEEDKEIPYDASWVCEASSVYNTSYPAYRAFDDSLNTGTSVNAGWMSANIHNDWVDLIVTFPTALKIKKWRVCNYHTSGNNTQYGGRNVHVHALKTGKFELLQPTPSDTIHLYSGMINKHEDTDSSSDSLHIIDSPALECKCVKFKLKDTQGSNLYIGLRHIDFLYKGVKIPYDASWICEASSYDGEKEGANSEYMPYMAFWDEGDGIDSPANESWRSRQSNYTDQVLMVTFPEAIKFDEVRVFNYFNSTVDYAMGIRYVTMIVNTVDKNYVFPSLDTNEDGDAENCVHAFRWYVSEVFRYNYADQYTKLAIGWDEDPVWYNQDRLKRYLEAYIIVKIPTLSSTTDTQIDIRSTNIDQESAGMIGLKGSANAQAVYDSTYEAVYIMEDELNPIVKPEAILIDSTSNELHSIAGNIIVNNKPSNALQSISKYFNVSSDNIKIPMPASFASETLSTLSNLSISVFLNQDEASTGIAFSLGDDVLSLQNVSLDNWDLSVDGTSLSNCITPTFYDDTKLLTATKSGNNYSLMIGDTLAGTDTNNSSSRLSNAQRNITAKSVRFNCADNLGSTTAVGLRSIEFYYKGVLVPYNISYTFNATSNEAFYTPRNAFDTALNKDGADVNNSWQSASGNTTNQVLTVAFLTQETFDEIRINNYHDSGSDTNKGVNNLTIDVNPISDFNTIWGSTLAGSQTIFDGTLTSHSSVDEEDEQTPDIDNVTRLAKSVRFNCADNHGDTTYMGLHSVSFIKDGVKIPWDDSWTVTATSNSDSNWLPRYAFDESVGNSSVNYTQTAWFSSSGSLTNQVITVDFPTAIEFDDIAIDNGHYQGTSVERGVKNMTIDIHPTSTFNTTWNSTLTGSQRIWEGSLVAHPFSNGWDINNETTERLLGFDTDQCTIGATALNNDNFKGGIGRIIISNVARSLAWNTLMNKALRGELVTQSETYGATTEDYVRYGFSFNDQITYAIWNGSAWRNVTSKDPAIHGVTDDYDWYYRGSVDTWTKSPQNNKENAFSNAVNESANRMTKTTVDNLTSINWEELNGFSSEGYFDIVASMYQSSTVTSQIRYIGIDHTKKIALMKPINLDEYDGVIEDSNVEWIFTELSTPRFNFEDSVTHWNTHWKCYAIVTGGDWVEITNRSSIPGITAGMITADKTLQFKFEWTKDTWYNKQELLPVLQWSITTV